jgi:hypothetical protein
MVIHTKSCNIPDSTVSCSHHQVGGDHRGRGRGLRADSLPPKPQEAAQGVMPRSPAGSRASTEGTPTRRVERHERESALAPPMIVHHHEKRKYQRDYMKKSIQEIDENFRSLELDGVPLHFHPATGAPFTLTGLP